jgi:hypothetical protein
MRRKFCPKRGGDISADIDIDFADRQQILDLVTTRAARIMHQGQPRRHNSGVYVTDIPWDPVTQCAAIDYETAESRGYFKIDLLNVGVYQLVRDPDHYQQMLDREPPWSRLWQDPDWATNLVHVGGHVNLLASMRPDSIPRMAAFISVIRPGKAHLQNRPWDQVFASVWDGDSSRGFVFKKSHAVGYAHLVGLHMNLLDLAD